MKYKTKQNGKETADLRLIPGGVGLENVASKECDEAMAASREWECDLGRDLPPDYGEVNWYSRLGAHMSWREKLWLVPPETRIGTGELAEALGCPRSWVYARTQMKAEDRIPHRKMGGNLRFVVGEVRAWIKISEEVYSRPGLGEVA